ELFGHERGAFTGAVITKKGKFELAHGGTIFLDEIGDMDLSLQSKILRVLQEGEFERVGGEKTITSDVRVIAATNQDLKAAVANRTFREDLYYRLSVIPIGLPELKDREEDIPLLAVHFLRKFSQELGAEAKEISKEAMNIFLNYPWPGNVRELENVIERAVLLGDHRSILPRDLPPHLRAPEAQPLDKALKEEATLEDLEHEYIGRVLEKTKGNQTRAARILGIDRRTLYRKVKKFALSRG
ncbi:MAG: sigma-54-dependent Fis family transcriptional regulator, partial [candidate division NC10 bacterium]|nr:sigma-54-dependent Fis family transcriptional regulator [candidate division NC10 bacterium]